MSDLVTSETPGSWTIMEQTVQDLVTGLTIQFTHVDKNPVIRIKRSFDVLAGYRELGFPQAQDYSSCLS